MLAARGGDADMRGVMLVRRGDVDRLDRGSSHSASTVS